MGHMGLKSSCWQGHVPSGDREQNALPSPVSRERPPSFPKPQSPHSNLCFPSHISLFSLSTYEDPCDYIDPKLIIHDNLPIAGSLT